MKDFVLDENCFCPTMWWKGVPLFNVQDAQEFICFCEEADVGFLGVEGFRVKNNNIIPDMKFIADFSPLISRCNEDFYNASRESAKDFSKTCDESVLLEFIMVKNS